MEILGKYMLDWLADRPQATPTAATGASARPQGPKASPAEGSAGGSGGSGGAGVAFEIHAYESIIATLGYLLSEVCVN